MNKGQNVRRGRTRHTPNKGGSNSNNGTGNRVDSKSRGNPQQNLDKYLGMARDALQAGDRVNEEYYLQFAEHFQRVINDRSQEEDNRQGRSKNNRNNNNRSRNQSRPDNQGNVADDPATQDQPKVADGNVDKEQKAKQSKLIEQDSTPSENKPKSRPARKREPRVKAAPADAESVPDKAPLPSSPEAVTTSSDKAAE